MWKYTVLRNSKYLHTISKKFIYIQMNLLSIAVWNYYQNNTTMY